MTGDSKRDVVFLVASTGMERMLSGLLGGPAGPGGRVGCGTFGLDPGEDVFVAANGDPGVYGTARELLSPFERLHRRAVVMLNAAWPGSPGAAAISDDLIRRLSGSWEEFAVIVVDPSIEAWVWRGLPDPAEVLPLPADHRKILTLSRHWGVDETAPDDPKAALDHLRRRHGVRVFDSDLGRAAEHMSPKHCTDPAFTLLCNHLQAWYPEKS
ncbi:methylation-associated defense system protein MAD4 [Thermomonospora umbrina]|uniref:Uncharacterized protein n=1 Tax=Thermomonospora umbrina TaxID=111806 RepID=A0A3D9SVR7_9ACTN|nr:hypothetical protein [Thermomonospora umbrina]REE95761.1 hypothetical protein DFJ69_1172 [Thermomonospora umbrina]